MSFDGRSDYPASSTFHVPVRDFCVELSRRARAQVHTSVGLASRIVDSDDVSSGICSILKRSITFRTSNLSLDYSKIINHMVS